MKTPGQITEYLQEQEWFNKFIENLKLNNPLKNTKRVLLGKEGRNTIAYAFCWFMTKEGHDFWSVESQRFTRWFDEEEIIKPEDEIEFTFYDENENFLGTIEF